MAYVAHSTGETGPLAFTMTTSGSSPWVAVGPCLPNKITACATFTGTTGIIKLQGCVSTASTATPIAVLQRTYAQRSANITSTVATPAIGFVRVNTTTIQAGKLIRLSVVVVP